MRVTKKVIAAVLILCMMLQISGEIENASGETVSTEVGTVDVTLDSTSTWTLTADTYVTTFNGDAAYVENTKCTGKISISAGFTCIIDDSGSCDEDSHRMFPVYFRALYHQI